MAEVSTTSVCARIEPVSQPGNCRRTDTLTGGWIGAGSADGLCFRGSAKTKMGHDVL